ncbi:MAG TPA: hypothetical protein VF795_11035 [Desulfuromonadaceae bacterium]
MRQNRRHTWLFSFTDVAFLLLLVYTQFGRLNTATEPVAEMRLPVPTVANSPELMRRKAEQDYRQVLVDRHSDRPYHLVRITGGNEVSRSAPLSLDELQAACQAVLDGKKGEPRPVVVPLPESYSSDLLQAASLVGKLWSEDGTAVVHTRQNGEGTATLRPPRPEGDGRS